MQLPQLGIVSIQMLSEFLEKSVNKNVKSVCFSKQVLHKYSVFILIWIFGFVLQQSPAMIALIVLVSVLSMDYPQNIKLMLLNEKAASAP